MSKPRPVFSLLEERILLAAQPVVSVGGDLQPLIGDQSQLTITFDNQPDATGGSDTGYAPYVDLILPQNGADGTGPGSTPPDENDGVSFVSASFLGAAVDTTVLEFDANGQAVHPFARDTSGQLRVVNAADYGATAGDQLVVLRLPFGSFVPEQPVASIQVTVQVSPLADLGAPLPVTAVGGFAFGRDAQDNPTTDAPVLGLPATASIEPTLLRVGKSFIGPEGETATGPNFPRSYIVTLDLAPGQTLTDASLLDTLPDGIVVLGAPVLTGAPGTATYDPATHTVSATLTGPVTGGAGAEATLTIDFYVAETLVPGTPGTPVLDPASGGSRTLENNVSAEATWDPIDPRDDPVLVTVDPPGPEAVFTAKSIATQKTQAIAVDANAPGLGPGDTLEYAIEVQVSDYFTLRDLVLNDLLSDGQAFVEGSARLEVLEAGAALGSGVFVPANLLVARSGVDGRTSLTFDVSGQLVDNGAPDGVLVGGDVGGNGDGVPERGPTTLRIVYQTTVERFFVANGEAVGQGDTLSNEARIDAAVLDGQGNPTGGTPGDGSAAAGTIETGEIEKSVYALNGALVGSGPVQIVAGDLVTFRLTYALPQTLTNELRLTDYLPLPVFDVDNFTLTLLDVVSPDAPGLNVAKWGPDASGFDGLLTEIPEVITNSAQNSLTFVFRNLEPAVPTATTADILFTIQVTDRAFGDGLLLTNQVSATEISTGGTTTTSQAITQVTLTDPVLRLTKGIVATDSPEGDFTPGTVGPVPFSAPGSGGVRFTGTIDSTNLAAVPVDSDLSDVDAGDRVSFAIIVENVGTGRDGAFDIVIQDSIPQGYRIPAGGLNLQVTDGAGNALAFTGDLFGAGIALVDQAGAGALSRFAATGGANILVITYDLEITETPQPRSQITNVGSIDNYAAFEGGIDRVPTTPEPTEDIATTRIGDPGFEKTAVSTSVAETGSEFGDAALFDLTVGERITFDLTATLREGRILGFEIVDALPAGLTLVAGGAEVVSIGSNIFARNPDGTTGAPLPVPTIITSGNLIAFRFESDIVNLPDNIVSAADQIVVRVTAVVADVPTNAAGTVLDNTGELRFVVAGETVSIEDTARAEVVAPSFLPTKTADRSVVEGDDIVTYTVSLTPVASNFPGPVFDVAITDDLLPGSLTLVAGSASLVTTPAGGATLSEAGGVVTVTLPVLLPGESLVFTYQARVEPTVVAGSVLPNTADFAGDSYPGMSPDGVEREFIRDASAEVRVPGAGIVKTVRTEDTSLPETGSNRFNPARPDLAIGEEVTYRIVVAFPEAVTTNVEVGDVLPLGFAFVGATTLNIGDNLTVSGATPLQVTGDGIITPVTLRYVVGQVVNTPDGVINDADTITFTVTARVLDTAVNVAGRAPVNTASVIFGDGILREATATVDIVEPSVTIDKQANQSTGDAGDRVSYQVRILAPGVQSGPAYDVVVTDTVPVGMDIDEASLRFTAAVPAGSVLAYDSVTRIITARIPVFVFEDPAIVIAYDAVVAPGVRPAEVLTNTAAVVFDSHPGDPGDLFERDYGPFTDTETFTVDLPALSKRVLETDIPETQFARLQPLVQDVAIGETVTYLVTLRLPEATTSIVLTDLLPVAEGAPLSSGNMELISSRVVAIGGNLVFFNPLAPGVGDAGVGLDGNGDGIVDRVSWDFGLVRNVADNTESEDDLIVVEVVARVINDPANQPGDQLINLAQAQYTKADDTTALVTQTETVEIVGPELLVDKSASVQSGDAGDIVTYTVVVTHDQVLSTADAYALTITDVLVPGLDLVAGSVTAAVVGSTVGVVDIRTGNAVGDTSVEVSLTQLRNFLATPDDVLTVTYQARINESVRPGDTLPNTATLVWQSAPGQLAQDGSPLFPQARPDSAADDAIVEIVFVDTLTKTVIATSLPETESAFFNPANPDLAIGELVTYELRIRLGEGTQQVLVQDTLPAGLEFVEGEVFSIGANITGALLAAGDRPTVTGGAVTFDFGNDVVDTGDNQVNDADVIVMRVTARILPGNDAGDVLTNAATFTTDNAVLRANAPIDVVEPEVTIAKDASVATGDAGDEVTFTVVIAQGATASAPLYDLLAVDALPAGYTLVVGSSSATRGTVSEAGNTVRVELAGAALLPADDPATAADDSRIVLTYRAVLVDAVQPGQVVTNSVRFDGTSAPGGGPTTQAYTGTDDASVTVVMPVALTKTIIATSLPETGSGAFDPDNPDVAIGETVTFELVVTLSEGTQTLVVSDTLPAGFGLVSAAVTGVGAGLPASLTSTANSGTGQGILFDFGTVVNTGNNLAGDGTVTITVVARVLDVAGNQVGTILTNAAAVEVTSPSNPGAPGGTVTDADAVSVDVVAPDVVITKASSIATGDAGDEVTFTVVVTQRPGATAPLYDLVVTDPVPAGMALVAGSATTTRGIVVAAGGTLRVEVPGAALAAVDDPLTASDEASVTITYRVRLTDAVQPGQVIVNEAAFAGLSAPAAGAGGEARAFAGTDDASVTVVMPVALDKQVFATSQPEAGRPATDLAVGETATYRLTATLSEGTQTLVISDALPAGLEVLSAGLAAVGAGVNAGTPAVAILGQSVTFDFGTVVATGNNDVTDATVTVEIIARVRDVPGNVDGTQLTNAGRVTIASPDDPDATGGTETATDATTTTVVEPALLIDKAVPTAFLRPGETVTYTVTLSHAPASTAGAYDIVLADLLADPYLELVAGSVVASAGTVTLGNGASDTTVRVDVPVLALGDVLTVTFVARVTADAPGGVTLANTVVADFDSATGPDGRPDSVTDGTETPGVPALVKEIVATSNPDTGSDQFDPNVPDLAVGETLTYRLTITLPQGTTDNLVLSDLLPPALQPLDARVVSVGAGLVAGAPTIGIAGQAVTLAFGTVVNGSTAAIGAEDTIVVEVDARVIDLAGVAAGAPLVNAAEAAFTIGGRDGTLEVTAPAELVEPQLDIAKRVDTATGDAGDRFTYTVTITHATDSTAAAYDIVVTDVLDPVFAPVSVASNIGTATITGNTVRLEIPRLLTTEGPVVLTYVVAFRDTVEPGQVVGNTAALGFDSNPGPGGRPDDGEASAPDVTAVFGLALDKTIVATSLPETGSDRFDPDAPDLAVGETVTYELVATLAEGTQRLVITDTMPLGLLPLAGQAVVVSTGAGISAGAGGTLTPTAVISGQGITFDFGTIVNTGDNAANGGDQVVLRITAQVIDLPINTNGRQVENDAEAVISSPTDPTAPGGTVIAMDSALADIVVPRFLLDKAVDRTSGDAGDVFTYLLTLAPAAGTDAPAFDILVEDALSSFLVVVPGSVTTSVGTATLAGNTIRIEIPVLLPDAPPVIITYRAAFADAIEPGQVVPNLATLDYATAPDQGRLLGDDAEASVVGTFRVALTKEVVATSLPETGSQYFDPSRPDIAFGETVTFRLTATLSEGTQRFVISDTLPANLIPEAARVVSVGAGIAAGAPAITIIGGRVVFDFGTVVNTGDNIGDDQVVVEIVARLNAVPDAGTVLTNAADATVSSPTDPTVPGGSLVATDATSVEAVAAVLVFDKQAAPASVGLGEAITYTLVLSHAPDSTAPAYEVVVTDPLSEASLRLVPGSVVVSTGTVVTGNGAGDTAVRVTVPVLLPGQVLTISFQALAVGIPVPDGVAPNTAAFDSTSAPGVLPPGFARPESGEDTASVQIASGLPPPTGGLLAEFEDAFRRIGRNAIEVPLILSGTAQPGAAVALALQDANGAPITLVGLTADVGGNWMASPIATGAPGGADDGALAEVRQLAGREGARAGASLPAPGPGVPSAAISGSPFTVAASAAPAAFDARTAMDGMRVTFGGAVQPGGTFVGATENPGLVIAAPTAAAVQRDQAGFSAPTSLAWNRFALDFAAAAAASGTAAR